MASTSGASTPFVKNLASSDRKIREQALASLQHFLASKYGRPSAPPLRFADAYKLWAGLFYALWMADRPLPQQRLCADLAALPRATGLPDASVAVWLRAFWATMAHQWTTGIDVLRMDKFLLLVRRVLNAQLAWMAGKTEEAKDAKDAKDAKKAKKAKSAKGKAANKSVSSSALALGLDVLREWPYNPEGEAPMEQDEDERKKKKEKTDDSEKEEEEHNDDDDDDRERRPRKRARKAEPPTLHIAVGLTLHAVDIWVDELERLGLLGEEEEEEEDNEDNDSLARQVYAIVETLASKTTSKAVRKRAREALEDERLPWNEKKEGEEGEEEAGKEANGDNDDDAASWNGLDD